ncbi:hypothetical protein TSUD_120060 [Trifolium subterraneum]|uniref:Reverse transcriptase zinc-binding domain-containing protein n=1 Tax=Trifolium subterraneum TaxID=3900 RepID=A0A1B5Z7B6_TRISU|nr:hypothetical protein TSUD_120060 [Trifolium subterraneum]
MYSLFQYVYSILSPLSTYTVFKSLQSQIGVDVLALKIQFGNVKAGLRLPFPQIEGSKCLRFVEAVNGSGTMCRRRKAAVVSEKKRLILEQAQRSNNRGGGCRKHAEHSGSAESVSYVPAGVGRSSEGIQLEVILPDAGPAMPQSELGVSFDEMVRKMARRCVVINDNGTEASVGDARNWNGEDLWQFNWRRRLFVWENTLLEDLLAVLIQVILLVEEDQWIWRPEDGGKFSVKSTYVLVSNLIVTGGGTVSREEASAFKAKWECPAPSKVSAFLWRLLHDRIRLELYKRRVIQAEGNQECAFCRNCTETAVHIVVL